MSCSLSLESTFTDREVEKTFVDLARPMYEGMIEPSTLLPRELGNSYTASCYTGLLSLISSWHSASSDGGNGGEDSTANSSSFSADGDHAWFDHEAAAAPSVGTGPPLGTQTLVFSC